MSWYCVYTKPGQMDKARRNIQRQGRAAFYPKIRVQRVIRGKKQWVIRPLFPNYLFADFSLADHYGAIRSTLGVSRVVSFGGPPPEVPQTIIDSLKSGENQGRVFSLGPEQFREGEEVRVIAGPLAGLRAVFKSELKGRDRVIILLDLLKTSVQSELSRDAITKD
jgi:transcriptional antiterminator RfaH